MNAERRKKINAAIANLQALQEQIEELQSDEQDAFDNMPESIQQGEKGQQSESAIDELGNAASQIEEAISSLENATE